MGCEGKKGQELKDCNEKAKKTPVTVADLNAANFKNRDVAVWAKKTKSEKTKNTPRSTGLATLNTRTKIPRLKKR